MGKLNISVKNEVETRFREEVFKRKGMKKGNLKDAVEEAILLWISASSDDESKVHKR